jgi:cytochrome c biogenesis protein CcmG, thiol:disulfide interchange protein DsbE
MQIIRRILFVLLILSLAAGLRAQDSLMQARLKSLHGQILPFSTIRKSDTLFLICFWSTTDDQSINQLNAMKAMVTKWKALVSFRLLAVSIDEGKDANKIRPVVNMNEWTDFEVFDDLYGELRKSLHSNNLPQSFVLKNGRILYQQSGWSPGTEHYLFDKVEAAKNERP